MTIRRYILAAMLAVSFAVAPCFAGDGDPVREGKAATIILRTTTLSTTGPTDDLDVSNVNVIKVDTTSNNVTIGGFTGGVDGQQIAIVIVNATNNTTLENVEGTGNQDIYLESAVDETKTATFGGWILECDGTHWYQTGGGGAGFDPTTVDSVAWSDGANASNVWTFDVSGTDVTITYGSASVTVVGDHAATSYTATPTPAPGITLIDSDDPQSKVAVKIYGNLSDVTADAQIGDVYFQSMGGAGTPGTLETFMWYDGSVQSLILLYGSFHMPEITTPTDIPDYGALYWKSDDKLYGQDGAGVEHLVTLGASDYGEMGAEYGSSATEIINAADEWHAMHHANINGLPPHLNSGFTFTAGSEGVIASIADAGGGIVTVTDDAHGLLAGDIVTQNGCADANYNGVFEVLTVPTASTYTITATWGTTDTGTWQMGSYLLVATTGVYRGMWNSSFSQSLNNTQTSIVSPYINVTQSTKAVSTTLLTNNTDIKTIGGGGLISLSVGDRVWFAVRSTSAQTLTFPICNITLH